MSSNFLLQCWLPARFTMVFFSSSSGYHYVGFASRSPRNDCDFLAYDRLLWNMSDTQEVDFFHWWRHCKICTSFIRELMNTQTKNCINADTQKRLTFLTKRGTMRQRGDHRGVDHRLVNQSKSRKSIHPPHFVQMRFTILFVPGCGHMELYLWICKLCQWKCTRMLFMDFYSCSWTKPSKHLGTWDFLSTYFPLHDSWGIWVSPCRLFFSINGLKCLIYLEQCAVCVVLFLHVKIPYHYKIFPLHC